MKPDSSRIVARLQALKEENWLGQARSWWPDFLFHVTDVQNAARILDAGRVLSRAQCIATGAMAVDSASEEVLGSTNRRWMEYARLYFRPRTPFQYQTEGFRPVGQRGSLNAYCPMPIVLLFDSISILTRDDSQFSDGNLASPNVEVGRSADFFDRLPFREIYHDSSLTDDEKRSIIYHRHAEVIVPDELELTALRRIWCRTPAEQETLQSLAPSKAWSMFSGRVGSSPRPNLFNRQWTFVERVELSANRIEIQLNPWSRTRGPFAARAEVSEGRSGEVAVWENPTFHPEPHQNTLALALPFATPRPRYSVQFWLDGNLAYAGAYIGDEQSSLH